MSVDNLLRKDTQQAPTYLSFSIKLEHFDQLQSMGKGSISLPEKVLEAFISYFSIICLKKEGTHITGWFSKQGHLGPLDSALIESPAPCSPIVIDSLCRWPFCKCRCRVDIGVSCCKCAPTTALYVLQPSRPGAYFSFSPDTHYPASYSWLPPAGAALISGLFWAQHWALQVSSMAPAPEERVGRNSPRSIRDRSSHMYPLT